MPAAAAQHDAVLGGLEVAGGPPRKLQLRILQIQMKTKEDSSPLPPHAHTPTCDASSSSEGSRSE